MELDRGSLARLDRKLLAALGRDEVYRMVRVPAKEAKWSTWKRYCETAGISMGRAIVTLIDRELVSVFGDRSDDHLPVFAQQAEEELANRQEQVARREEKAAEASGAERTASDVGGRVGDPGTAGRVRREDGCSNLRGHTKVGRNERCPCGSGLKYKHCHGLRGR